MPFTVMPYAVCLSCEGQKKSKHDKFYFIENIFNLLVVINSLRRSYNAKKLNETEIK